MTLPLPVADIVEIQQTLARHGHVVASRALGATTTRVVFQQPHPTWGAS
jgi:hypothetical protein